MRQLELNLAEVNWWAPDKLRETLEKAACVQITLEISDLYESDSKHQLARVTS
ncbi:hypothetical protein Enr8_15620 [Blastopirellula retiformator]|uniref:Uncharacterized protein n=1 Tax=Blastopirellula retiformator TaxID=2527970 RepID=A0A5C5V6I4_9BACT|nr:hypothetical protein Enr8_15620 [Blastopirellula retiformator]